MPNMESPEGHDFVVVDVDDVSSGDERSPLSPSKIKEIQQWLQPTDFLGESSEYNKHINSYVSGTGNWIQETVAYRKWHDSSGHGALWTKAIAGAGKSVFAAMIASKLAKTENVPVLFFFFRQIIATNHHPQYLARDFISQLLKYSPVLQARMKKHIDARRTVDNISTNELWQDVVYASTVLPKIYCIVDALDEMDIDQEGFLQNLVDLGKQKPATIKLLLTSRPLPRIETVLRDSSVLQVRLEQQLVDKDITIYINHRLSQHADLNEELCNAIKTAIGEKAKGSFLYSRLMMDELLIGHFPHMIPDIKYLQRSLDWLPVTLEDMYNGMLLDHSLRSGVPQELQLLILSWVTHSSRPLRLLEIAAMLDGSNSSQPSGLNRDTKALVRGACGPLLEILEDETISVIHHSFTEFLTDLSREKRPAPGSVHPQFPVITSQATHHLLAVTCLKYVTGGALSVWVVKERAEDDQFYNRPSAAQRGIKLQFPFLDYAMNNWYIHAGKVATLDANLYSMINVVIKPETHNSKAWLDLVWPGNNIDQISPLHIASWAGMTNYAARLLDQGVDANAVDGKGRTPLSWASARGHTKLVELLLTAISDPDVDDCVGLKPLHYAAQANHSVIVKLLSKAGVNPLTPKTKENPGQICGNAPTSRGETPFLYATQAGCTESVREMIPYLDAKALNDALCTASISGKSGVVELLLASPEVSADPPITHRSDTPLFLAATVLNAHIIQALLEAGADPRRRSPNNDPDQMMWISSWSLEETKGNLDPTPLHALAGVSRRSCTRNSDPENIKACFELLYQAGCDLNAIDREGRTALHYSVESGLGNNSNHTLTKLLLENGASPMSKDTKGNTPLHLIELTSYGLAQGIAELLLDHGADVNARRESDGRTPIHTAVDTIHELDLKCLLPFVQDWNIRDSKGDTVFHIILEKSYHPATALSMLIEAGANPNIRNKSGLVPLHKTRDITGQGKAAIELLIKSGADLESRDNDGRTTLLRAISGPDFPKMATWLLDLGADLHAVDFQGNGALHTACNRRSGCNQDTIQSLINAGTNPFRVNNSGNTVLHEVASNYKAFSTEEVAGIVKLLLKTGIPPGAQNNLGQTALHLVCSSIPGEHLLRGKESDSLDVFFGPEMGVGLDAQDYSGSRPIHLAATISEELVARLLSQGADATAATDEGRNILHIAARARQPNIIGLVLDHFPNSSLPSLLNSKDCDGRTPLHDACRSGRPETVAILLKAGADSNARDKQRRTPLHSCSEFEEERTLWPTDGLSLEVGSAQDAKGVLKADRTRPNHWNVRRDQRSSDVWRGISTENDTVRLEEIIHLLIAHGAEVDAMDRQQHFPIDTAVEMGCAEAVRILEPMMEDIYARPDDRKRYGWRGNRRLRPFEAAYLGLNSKFIPAILRSQIDDSGSNLGLCRELLALGQFDAIRQLPRFGIRFGPFNRENHHDSDDFLSELAKWGYADLFDTLGATIEDPSWINGNEAVRSVRPYLLTAVGRTLPNLETIRVIVEKFHADVNIQPPTSVYQNGGGYKYPPGASALHILARAKHWWELKGMKYLLAHGANPELKNEKGQSVIHIAVSNDHTYGARRRRETTKLLLDHGANPNTLDDDGLSCLNKAIHDIELVKMLILSGADVSLGNQPILFSAIDAGDVTAVQTVLEAGADCNTRATRPVVFNEWQQERINPYDYYPLHYAASWKFNTDQAKLVTSTIIKRLLENGADPWLDFQDGQTTILHDIVQHGGIVEPFLELPELDLERRDASGRTLLLAACASASCHALTLYEKGADLSAVSEDGNNALHHILRASSSNIKDDFKKTFTLFIKRRPELVHQTSGMGYKPFHYAIQRQLQWAVQELIEAGANTLETDPDGNTPLHHLGGSMFSSPETFSPLFKSFLDLGISINAKNRQGETPVFGYFRAGYRPYLSRSARRTDFVLWQEAGVDIFARNNDGETLLHVTAKRVYGNFIIAQENEKDVVNSFKFLLSLGLDPMVEDIHQRTSLDVAAACGNEGILELFKRDRKAEIEEPEDSEDEMVDF